jgi:hypothetical protein
MFLVKVFSSKIIRHVAYDIDLWEEWGIDFLRRVFEGILYSGVYMEPNAKNRNADWLNS